MKIRSLLTLFVLCSGLPQLVAQRAAALEALGQLFSESSVFRASNTLVRTTELSSLSHGLEYLHAPRNFSTVYPSDHLLYGPELERALLEAHNLSDRRISEFGRLYSPVISPREAALHAQFLTTLEAMLSSSQTSPKTRLECQLVLEAYVAGLQQVHYAVTAGSGTGGRLPPMPPVMLTTEAADNWRSAHAEEASTKAEKEEKGEEDPNLDTLALDTARQHSQGYTQRHSSASDTGFPNWMFVLLAVLFYLPFSQFGFSRLMRKAGREDTSSWLPVWRLGPVFQLCGLAARDAWILLIPGINLYYWAGVNYRLCKVFQYPRYLAALGFLAPGLLWFAIGYSNRYYIGPERAGLR